MLLALRRRHPTLTRVSNTVHSRCRTSPCGFQPQLPAGEPQIVISPSKSRIPVKMGRECDTLGDKFSPRKKGRPSPLPKQFLRTSVTHTDTPETRPTSGSQVRLRPLRSVCPRSHGVDIYRSRSSLTHRTLSAKRKGGKNLPTSLGKHSSKPSPGSQAPVWEPRISRQSTGKRRFPSWSLGTRVKSRTACCLSLAYASGYDGW